MTENHFVSPADSKLLAIKLNKDSNFDIKGLIKHNIDFVIPSAFYTKNFDMYVVEGTLLKNLSKINLIYHPC